VVQLLQAFANTCPKGLVSTVTATSQVPACLILCCHPTRAGYVQIRAFNKEAFLHVEVRIGRCFDETVASQTLHANIPINTLLVKTVTLSGWWTPLSTWLVSPHAIRCSDPGDSRHCFQCSVQKEFFDLVKKT